MDKIAEFNVTEATVTKILEVLMKEKIEFGKLHEQWWELSQFFYQIANLI